LRGLEKDRPLAAVVAPETRLAVEERQRDVFGYGLWRTGELADV
jgi:hypothetical protein